MSRSKIPVLLLKCLAILGITLCCIELVCGVFFNLYKERFTFYNLNKYVVTAAEVEKLKESYNFELGWKIRYPTPYGERPRQNEYPKAVLSVFGDSFTHCDQVKDDQSWEEHLSQTLNSTVYNFGGGGYGTDQALLRFRQDYPKVKTPLVGLGLITENINRIVNVYRPFYFERTGGLLSKPRFVLNNNSLQLIENPIKNSDQLIQLLNPTFVQSLGKNDWWFNRDSLPFLHFPYSAILLNKRFWLESIYRKRGREIDDMDPRPWEDLWLFPPARDLMFAILDNFVSEATAQGAKPIIILLPRRFEVIQKVKNTQPKDAQILLDYCQSKKYLCFDGISALASQAKDERQVNAFYGGHLSPLGNRVLAGEMGKFIAALKSQLP